VSDRWALDAHGDLIALCADCRDPITGASWRGRCLDCHEASLLPPEAVGESWADIYLGHPDSYPDD
jgi:hypothetical protein